MKNAPPHIITDSSVTVIINGNPLTMNSDNANYNNVIEALADGRYDCLEDMFDTGKAIAAFAEGNFEITDSEIRYKGELIHNHVVDRILAFMQNGLPYKPLLNFLDKLMANPSRRAVNELYTFLEHKNMPLTADGNFQAYKSVKADFTDHHTGKFSNKVGAVLEMVRNTVCDDANVGCSYGFHAGSLEYAKSFGGVGSRLLIVEINPADVVSVPLDSDCQKLRTAKYEVVSEFVRPLDEPLVCGDCDCDEGECGECGESDYDESDDEFDSGYEAGYRAALSDKANKQPRNKDGSFAKIV